MKPFLKWAGGKRWLVAAHPNLVDVGDGRLVEPFLGSAAVFFHVEPASALLADANSELIETYTAVRDHSDEVKSLLASHQAKHSHSYYYDVRASKPDSIAERAARLIYLNRTCWNALYRVNLKGDFNVPKGSKDTVVLPDDDFDAWSVALAGTELLSQDFELTVDAAKSGDFLYCDPPYTVKHNNNNFVKYNEHIFSWADQERLAKALRRAADRGVRIVLSNADHESIHELYGEDVWTRLVLTRQSVLASASARRGLTSEVVISNAFGIEDSDEGDRAHIGADLAERSEA